MGERSHGGQIADSEQRLIGFAIYEQIGISRYNPSAMQKVEIAGTPFGCLLVFDCEILSKEGFDAST